jgi:hypothetical protein
MMEGENLYTRLGGIEDPFVLVRTGHLALQTTGTLDGVYMQGSLHEILLCGMLGAVVDFLLRLNLYL